MTPELLNALFQGAVLLFGALGITAAQRSSRSAVRAREFRDLQNRHLVAIGHIYRLELDRASHGLPLIPRPSALEDPTNGPPGPPAPTPAAP